MLIVVEFLRTHEDRLRQTITLRDRWAYVHLLRHTPAEADARFGSVKYGRHRARVVLAEMVSEYSCILLAPALVLFTERFGMWYNLGYQPSAPINVLELLLGLALQICAEALVDLLCIRVETRDGIPVLEAWQKAGAGNRRRVVYVWLLASAISLAYFFMGGAFFFNMPAPCRPFPCAQCMAAGGKGAGPHLGGKGSAAMVVEWCVSHFPGVGLNASSTAAP